MLLESKDANISAYLARREILRSLKKSIDTVAIMQDEISKRDANDSGAIGDAYELAIRAYLTGRRWAQVKRQGASDIVLSIMGEKYKVEIKSACGEIDDTLKADLIIYCPLVDSEIPVEAQSYIFSRSQWLAFINGYNGRGSLTRVKKSSSGKTVTSFQSFYGSETVRPTASKALANYIWNTMADTAMLDEIIG